MIILLAINTISSKLFVHIHFFRHEQKYVTFVQEQSLRKCNLVHARINNAAFEALFNVDGCSITKSKQRIKKKMGIDGDLSLEEHLMKGK